MDGEGFENVSTMARIAFPNQRSQSLIDIDSTETKSLNPAATALKASVELEDNRSFSKVSSEVKSSLPVAATSLAAVPLESPQVTTQLKIETLQAH